MDHLRCDLKDLPPKFYRVQYPGCRTSYTSTDGLKAADTTTFCKDDDEFGESVERQFTWDCRELQPYISVFSDNAERWDIKWSMEGSLEAQKSGLGNHRHRHTKTRRRVRLPVGLSHERTGHRTPRASIAAPKWGVFVPPSHSSNCN